MSGNINPGGSGGGTSTPDLSNYVTQQQFTDAVPGTFTDLTDVYANGLPSVRGDQWMDDGSGNLMRVPNAIWGDSTKLARLLAGTGGASDISITTTALSAGQVGVAYSQTITATGGAIDANSRYEWKIVGSLPSGLTFAPASTANGGTAPYGRLASATITGTPAAAQQGTYNVTITVRDALENTATLTANIVIAAVSVPMAFTMPTLPNAKCGAAYSQSLASAVSAGTGSYTFTAATFGDTLAINSAGLITGTATTPQQLSISVTVTDGSTTLTRTGTILIESKATTRFDLSDLIGPEGGSYTYSGLAGRPSTVDPAYNVAQINSRASQAAAVPSGLGGLYSTQGTIASPGTIIIGNATSTASWNAPLILGAAAANWDCGNVVFKLAANQPSVPVSSNIGAAILSNTGAPGGQVYIRVDGNSVNQPTSTTTNPTYGSYSHGVRWWSPTAAVKGTFIIKNVRGVVGGNIPTATEVFHGQIIGGVGGDNIILTLDTDDGTASPTNNSASGFKWQYTVNDASNFAPTSTVLATCSNVRHGIGGYALGNIQVETGSSFTDCASAWNFEAGIAATPTSYPTRTITIGRSGGATHGQITTTRCGTDFGSGRFNGNNTGNSRAAATVQIDTVHVYGWDSLNECSSIFIVGTAPETGYTFHNQQVTQPTLISGSNRSSVAALEYGNALNSTLHLTNSAKTTLTGCTVHWTGTVGRQCRPGATDAAGYANTTGTYTVV